MTPDMPSRLSQGGWVALRWGLAGVFLWAGLAKALDVGQFVQDIEAYQILTGHSAQIMALYLPWLEIVCAMALLLGWLSRGAVFLLIGLMLVFLTSLLWAWGQGLSIACGCFGQSQLLGSYPAMIGRDLLLLAGLVILAMRMNSAGTASGSLRLRSCTLIPTNTLPCLLAIGAELLANYSGVVLGSSFPSPVPATLFRLAGTGQLKALGGRAKVAADGARAFGALWGLSASCLPGQLRSTADGLGSAADGGPAPTRASDRQASA